MRFCWLGALGGVACGAPSVDLDPGTSAEAVDTDAPEVEGWSWDGSGPFAHEVVLFEPGPYAGFGQQGMPDIVLGPPLGGGDIGSYDVVSLGEEGQIVLGLGPHGLVDGPGDDLVVFENAFVGFPEWAEVGVSVDGETWLTWPCNSTDGDGCAGNENVWSHPDNEIGPLSPDAGGDRFDLADLGIAEARFVRIIDTGTNFYEGIAGGFDLDAIALIHSTMGDEQ